MPRSVTTTLGPRPSQPPSRRMRSACSAPPRLPGDVRKSIVSTKLRLRLAHDHEDLAGVDRDLAGAAGTGQPRRRVVVRPDDGRVDVAEPVDLGGAQEPDVDEPALQVVAEQLEHADDRGRAGHDRRVADGQRQPRRPRPEDAGLVDELEVRRDRPLGEVDRDVRQTDPDEADVLAGQLARGRDDHHLGLAEGAGSVTEPPRCRGRRSCRDVGPSRPSGRPPRTDRRSGDTRRTAPGGVRRPGGRSPSKGSPPSPLRCACSMSGSANHSPMTGRCPRR